MSHVIISINIPPSPRSYLPTVKRLNLGVHDGPRVLLGLPVERGEAEAEEAAGQVEEAAPAHRGPEPVERLDDLLTESDHRGVVAVGEGRAVPDVPVEAAHDELHELVDPA